jgi:hypothetical protein
LDLLIPDSDQRWAYAAAAPGGVLLASGTVPNRLERGLRRLTGPPQGGAIPNIEAVL